MMNTKLAIILSVLSFSAFGQKEVTCNELRQEQPHFAEYQAGKMDSLVSLDLQIISNCIELDSIDIKILNPQVISVQMIQLKNGKTEINYGNIIDYIQEFKTTEQYQQGRQGFEFMLKYENRKINKADSLEVRENFRKMGFSNPDLYEILTVIYSKESSDLTYQEGISVFIESKESKTTKKTDVIGSPELLYGHFRVIETLDGLKSHLASDEPVLIYFSAIADVNSRKMEQFLFLDSKISQLLSEFNCFIGYVDDKTTITVEQKDTFRDKDLKTKGQFISEIEKLLLPQVNYPALLIVNSAFEVTDSFRYDKSKYEFIKYLERNRNER